MSPHIRIGPEPVLTAHAPSPPAAGSHCPASEGSAPAPNDVRNKISCSVYLPKAREISNNLCIKVSTGTFNT